MSTGLECEFIEVRDLGADRTDWFYLLQSWSCPRGAWDWREENPDVAGPFRDLDSAEEHLRRNHPNPGGHAVITLLKEEVMLDDSRRSAIESALRGPLTASPLPDDPVEIAASMTLLGTFGGAASTVFRAAENEDGTVLVSAHASWRPADEEAPLATSPVSVQVCATGARISMSDDAVFRPIMEEAEAKIARLWPGLPVIVLYDDTPPTPF